MEEEKYIKKFNEGYLLAKHKPELAQAVFKALEGKEDESALGLRDGGNEFLKESKEKDRFMEMHQNYKVGDKVSNQDKEPQKENPRDKGNFERD